MGAGTFSNSKVTTLTPAAKRRDGVEIVVRRDDFEVGDLAGGRVGVGRKGVDAIAHAAGGDGEHAAELSAAEDADGGAGEDWVPPRVSCPSRTLAVCFSRKGAEFFAQVGPGVGEDRDGERAALVAPALPMASVPTGTPAGIWTMESRESMPLRALLSMGTPSTGRMVWAAVMPGRWAAPPAPAMMTSRPRSARGGCEFCQQMRRAVGGDDAGFVRHAEVGERLARVGAWCPNRTCCP